MDPTLIEHRIDGMQDAGLFMASEDNLRATLGPGHSDGVAGCRQGDVFCQSEAVIRPLHGISETQVRRPVEKRPQLTSGIGQRRLTSLNNDASSLHG